MEPQIEAPSPWLVMNRDLLPGAGQALDVACGRGRHALWLASAAGLGVRAVDRDAAAIEELQAAADRLGLPLTAEVLDLEGAVVDLGTAAYDVVVVVRYLHRPLFPVLERALKPGGLLIYETFTVDRAARGRPRNPAFLLKRGELPTLVGALGVERYREGEAAGGCVASIVARKPGPIR